MLDPPLAVRAGKGAGFGGVLHNDDGDVWGCRFGFKPGAFTSLEGEVRAVMEGLQLCLERGVKDVIVETDNQTLVWMLHKRESVLSYLGDTLTKIYEAAASISLLSFSWTPREGNAMADKLAKFALDNSVFPVSSRLLPTVLNSG